MRSILLLIVFLGTYTANAQNYHRQYEIPSEFISPYSRMNTSDHLMADGNIVLGNFNDSLAFIQKIDNKTGDIIMLRTIDTRVKLSIPDTGRFIGESLFYPSQDTGIIVFYQRSYIGNSIGEPGSYTSLIKLDKQLNIEWSLVCRNPEKIHISYQGIASDASGATYLNYMNLNDTSFGICKIRKDGSVAADKQSAKEHMWETGYTSLYGSMIALEGSRLMVISQSDYFTTVLDTSLNVIRSYRFTFGGALMANFHFNIWSKSVYKQGLIAAATSRFSYYKPAYYLMDTTGRLLKIDTSSNNESLLEISINENNRLVMRSGAPAGSGYTFRLQAMDTAGHTLFTRGFSNLYSANSLLLSGKDAYLLSCINSTRAKSNNIMRFESPAGHGFCEGSSDVVGIKFDGQIPFKTELIALTLLKEGNFRAEKSYLDTVASPSVAVINVCDLPTGIKKEEKTQFIVYSSGNQELQVIVPEVHNQSIFELRDITGRQIHVASLSGTKSTIQLPYISTGIYIWHVSGSIGKVFIE